MRKNSLGSTSGDAVWLMLIKFVTMALGLVTTRLLSQYLSIYDYGTYSQILLLVSTLAYMTVLGMVDGVNFFHCKEHDIRKREQYVSTIFALQGIVSTASGVLVLLLSRPLCMYFDNPDIKRLLIFAVTLPFFQNVLYMCQNLTVAVGKTRVLATRNLAVSVLRLAVTIPVVLTTRDVGAVLLLTVLLDIAQLGFFLWILNRNGCRIGLANVNFELFGEIIRYCLPMAVFIIVKALNKDIDKYLISLMTNTRTLAVYANASKSLPVDIVMHSFYTVLIPVITRRIAAEDYAGVTRLYRIFLELAYVSNTVICCAILVSAPQAMTLLYSEKYISGVAVFCVYILVDLLQFTNVTLILSAAGKTKTLMVLGVGSLGVNAVLNVLLYRWLGVVGPAVATLVTTLATGLLLMHLNARQLNIRLREFFDVKYLCLFVLESVAAVLLLGRLRKWLEQIGVQYVLILLLVSGIYGIGMLFMHGKRLKRNLQQLDQYSKK